MIFRIIREKGAGHTAATKCTPFKIKIIAKNLSALNQNLRKTHRKSGILHKA